MADKLRKVWICILGILQGFVGSYIALMGYICAFPDTVPGDKDYEEDAFFIPFGYMIMLTWIIVMIIAFVRLRHNKVNLLVFSVSWIIGAGLLVLFGYFR